MFLRSVSPSEALKEVVLCYLLFETGTDFPEWQTNTQMPAGLTAIGFSYGGVTKYATAKEREKPIPPCAIVGQHDIPYIISHKSFRRELLVILKPSGLYQLLRCNISEFSNELLSVSLIGLPGAGEIPERLARAKNSYEKIALVEDWLLKRLAKTYSKTHLTDYILGEIFSKKGTVPISRMAEKLRINKKQIERCFIEQLGLSPKKFAEIIRFNYLNQLFLNNSNISMQELVFLGEFCDQSHLIKHIEKLTGICPTQYKNFLQSSGITRFAHLHTIARMKEKFQMDGTRSAGF